MLWLAQVRADTTLLSMPSTLLVFGKSACSSPRLRCGVSARRVVRAPASPKTLCVVCTIPIRTAYATRSRRFAHRHSGAHWCACKPLGCDQRRWRYNVQMRRSKGAPRLRNIRTRAPPQISCVGLWFALRLQRVLVTRMYIDLVVSLRCWIAMGSASLAVRL